MSLSITDPNLQKHVDKKTYLREYLESVVKLGNKIPDFYDEIDRSFKKINKPSLIYPINDDLYIHINSFPAVLDGYNEYKIIDPPPADPDLTHLVDVQFGKAAADMKPPSERNERFMMVEEYLIKLLQVSDEPMDYSKFEIGKSKTIPVTSDLFDSLKYHFLRNRVGLGLLEPFLSDPHMEDISIIGAGNMFVEHKIFGPLKSPVWLTNSEIDNLMIGMAEQMGKTISHARPIVDATLPEGSRINIVYGTDISRKGTNATIRRFASTPISITEILNFKTMNSLQAAYIWMMFEVGMSCFICGETASGKTTTTMALSSFVKPSAKIVSAEDTPEITMPHPNWISEVTRNTGSEASSVGMFDLLKAALRQRPNYIMIGEIRGAEGNVAFQAMQTGHPVISTFHAANVKSLMQRLVAEPINVPKANAENLNIALFQGAVQGPDGGMLRRVLSINEIVGYDSVNDNVMFVPLFTWDPATDTTSFRGRGSSALFAMKVLQMRGMSKADEPLLYDELEGRARILDHWAANGILNYYDVYAEISKVFKLGWKNYMLEEQIA